MTQTITFHKLNEKFVWVSDEYPATAKIRVIRVSDGYFFNKLSKTFTATTITASEYDYVLVPVVGITDAYKVVFDDLPNVGMDLLFQIDNSSTKTYERHVYGGFGFNGSLGTCKVFGYLKTPDNRPLVNGLIVVSTLRDSYVRDITESTSNQLKALTDFEGYFEIDLFVGLSVQINIPMTGFVTRGKVPNVSTLELSQSCLQTAI
jgi:hypothetical protein